MKPLFVEAPFEVTNELEALGLDREGLLDTVARIVAARNNCTDNDVPAARGSQAYFTGTRVLRDIYCRNGWDKCEDGGMSCIFHKKRMIKVVMVNTDDCTGLDFDSLPQNRNRKGPRTDQAVSINQMWLQGFEDNIIQINPNQSDLQHWFLCVYAEDEVVRAELSYPKSFKGGFFTDFHKRIILLGADDGGNRPDKMRDYTPPDDIDFEISVTRKQA